MNQHLAITAFEARPNANTEAGLAWNWALAYRKMNWRVTVLTQRTVESEADQAAWSSIGAEYVALGESSLVKGPESIREMIQLRATYEKWHAMAANWLTEAKPSAHQHVALSTLRLPVPAAPRATATVVGPVGGCQNAVLRGLGLRKWPHELLRSTAGVAGQILRERRGARISPSSIVLVTNEETARHATRLGFSPVPMLVDGVRLQDVRTEARSLRPTMPVLGWAGRFVESKRPDIPVRVVAALKARGLDVHLSMAGAGTRAAAIETLADELDVRDRVSFHGRLAPSDMRSFYETCDIFLFNSMRDTGCVAVLEAAAHAVPTVGLRHQAVSFAVPREVARGPHRYVSASRYVTEAASRIEHLVNNPDEYALASSAALRFASRNTWETKAHQVSRLIGKAARVNALLD